MNDLKIILMHHGEARYNAKFGYKILTLGGFQKIARTTQELIEMNILSKNGESTFIWSSSKPWCTASAYACCQNLNEINFLASFELNQTYSIENKLIFIEKKLKEYFTLIIITHIDVLPEIQTNLIYEIWGNKPFKKEEIQTPVKVRVLLPDSKKLIIGDPT